MRQRRRLSRLQKWILVAAWENDASGDEPDLTYPEIKVGYFGMPSTHPARDEFAQRGQLFEKSKLQNYAKASASTSRAAHLLAERGLATVTRGKAVGAPRSRPLTEEQTRQLEEVDVLVKDGRYDEAKGISLDETYLSTRYGWRAIPSRAVLGRAEIRLTDEGAEVAKALSKSGAARD